MENYGFKYYGADDPSPLVLALELTEEEVLEHLKKILKGVNVIPHMVPKYRDDNPPPAVSCFTSTGTFLYISIIVGTFCLQFLA
jgi:hypothetical protein